MGIVDLLRKGFGYMLMCMGVSSPAARQKPVQQPPAEPPATGRETGK